MCGCQGDAPNGKSLLDRATTLTRCQKRVDEAKFAVDEARGAENAKKTEKCIELLSEALLALMIAEEKMTPSSMALTLPLTLTLPLIGGRDDRVR